jgi:hypothetical protein
MNSLPIARIPHIASAAVLGLAILIGVAAPEAMAARQRTFVASYGDDVANAPFDCDLAHPCRTFNVAIAHTLANGEIVILDTAGYGPMTIDKSIKIVGPAGVYGGISVQSGGANTGVVINAGDTDVVTLDIVGVSGAPLIGIDIQNAGTVHIEKTSINNFTQDTGGCIHVVSSKPIQVFVNDSFLRECFVGVWAEGTGPDASRLSLVVDNTRIQDGLNTVTPGNTAAFVLRDAVIASIRNNVLSAAGDGIYASNSNVNVRTRIHVMDTQFSRFGDGAIVTDGTAGASLPVNVALSHFNNSNAALLHRHGQVIYTSNVIANHTFSLVDCGGGAASVTSLGYGGGNGSNALGNNTDLAPFPSGCSGIITPTQFAGK